LVGQLVAQLARLQGARVIGLDLKAGRVELARTLGAHHGLTNGTAEAVASLTGGHGADVVILAAAAKSAAPCRLALDICRDRGRIVVVGAVDMHFPWNDMYMKEIQLFMSRAYGPGSYDPKYERKGEDYPYPYVRWTENRNMEEFLRLAASGELRIDPMVTHRFALKDAPAAYRLILDPTQGSLAVLLEYGSQTAAAPFAPKRKIVIAPQPVSKDVLGFALIGAGSLARWSHVPVLKKLPGVRVRAVQSGGGVRAKSFGTRFETDYATTDYEEILRDTSIDAVLIASRNQHHAEQAVEALRAGKHVFVEKPMALTAQECHDVLEAVETSGRLLTVGFNRRFAPYYLALRDQVRTRSGPVTINCRVNSPGISGSYWMADPAIGGAILGEACHFVDLFCWLLDANPVSSTAYSFPPEHKSPIAQNNLACAFQFADGSLATLNYSTVGSKTSGGERVEVFGESFGVVTENFKRLSVLRGMRRHSKKIWGDKGYRQQMEAFLQSVRTGEAPAVTAWDGARSTLLCLDLLESARSGLPQKTSLASFRES
jgi:predicted dehydrogenase